MATELKTNRLETTKRIKAMTNAHYKELIEAAKRKDRVVWCMGPAPFLPLRAMNIPYVHLENYGARLAARKAAAPFFRAAENWGLSKEACSYVRGALGCALLYAQDSPLSPEIEQYRIPKPSYIIAFNYCVSALNLAEIVRRELNIPIFVIDCYFNYELDDERKFNTYVPYMRKNIEAYIAFIEEQEGRRMDYKRLSELVAITKEMAILRAETLDMAKRIPTPITFWDGMIGLGAGNNLLGTPESIDYFKALKAEVQERVRKGIASIPGEQIRLAWDDVCVWSHLGYLSEFFGSRNAAVVYGRYTRSGGTVSSLKPELLDPSDPVGSIARDEALSSVMWHAEDKVKLYVKAVEEFSVDGIIGHCARTCRKLSVLQPLYLAEIERRTGVPVLRFDADHSDGDFYSPAEIDVRLEAFLEMLMVRKRKRLQSQ